MHRVPQDSRSVSNTQEAIRRMCKGTNSCVCWLFAASFSSPLLQREAMQGDETAFSCHSSGGFPKPAVYWLIDDAEEPPEGTVRTQTASLADSHLYNITSHLTINISKDSSVSCIIENRSMNETLTSTSCEWSARSVIRPSNTPVGHHLLTNLWFSLVLRWSEGHPGGESSIGGHVDLQHGSQCGGWDHGVGRSGLSDSPGQDK